MELNVDTAQKHYVNRVTTLSKTLALILFVSLPILTLFIGYQQGVRVQTSFNVDAPLDEVSRQTDESLEEESTYMFQGAARDLSFRIPDEWKVNSDNEGVTEVTESNVTLVRLISESSVDMDGVEITVGMSAGTRLYDDVEAAEPISAIQPRTIGGYPALETGSPSMRIYDRPELGEVFIVGIVVAANGDSYFVNGRGPADRYDNTRAAIEEIVATMKFK